MTRIGLLSDTHAYLDERIIKYLQECDEIWHAGDIGSLAVTDLLANIKPLKAVYGNIDGAEIRRAFPKVQRFLCEETEVLMTHIGGYPGKYFPEAMKLILQKPPKIFICGHSHILKIIFDKKYNLLHINPGASGNYGIHTVKTMVRFSINKTEIKNMEVIEIGKK